MKSIDDSFLQEDLTYTAQNCEALKQLHDCSILITGATGLIGSLLVKTLVRDNALHNKNLHILPVVRSMEKAQQVYGELLAQENLQCVVQDLLEPMDTVPHADYIIHCASVTSSKVMVNRPVDTILTAVSGTQHVLEYAVQTGTKAVVYVSSMEMYGTFEGAPTVTEDMLGYIDPLKLRSNYPESKRMCENLCIAYKEQYQLDVKIARLAQSFGAGILPWENRVFAQFARSAMAGENIVLHTTGASEGNYCYTRDAVAGIMTILMNGESGEAYNVANERTHTTILQMAQMVAQRIAQPPVQVVLDIPENNIYGYANEVHMTLSGEKLKKLGWNPQVDLEEAYRRMIGSMLCGEENL